MLHMGKHQRCFYPLCFLTNQVYREAAVVFVCLTRLKKSPCVMGWNGSWPASDRQSCYKLLLKTDFTMSRYLLEFPDIVPSSVVVVRDGFLIQ